MVNPWLDVKGPDYRAPIDREMLDEIFRRDSHLKDVFKLDSVPGPFVGRMDRAKVVVLQLNPGWSADDAADSAGEAKPELLRALRFETDTPFFHVDDRFRNTTGGGLWWRRRLSHLADRTSWAAVGDRLMALEFIGYPSVNWSGLPIPLPSQAFSFSLVEQAMERGCIVVAARAWHQWVWNVPALYSYDPVIHLRSPRFTGLSPGNMSDVEFGSLVTAIAE